jgi:hypothetical protein
MHIHNLMLIYYITLVNHIRANFHDNFGIQPLPDLPSPEWISNALATHPHIAVQEAALLTTFSSMEKVLLIKSHFEPITNQSLLIHTLPDLIFPLCFNSQNPNNMTADFLITTAPEWSHPRNFLPPTLQPEEQIYTTSPEHLHSLQGNIVLISPAHPIPFHTEVSTMPLPNPLSFFFKNPDTNLTFLSSWAFRTFSSLLDNTYILC